MIRIHPYRQGSRSAFALARELGGRLLRREGSKYVPAAGDVVINWGDSQCRDYTPARLLNPPSAISLASNKREAFAAFSKAGVQIPEFATTKEDVSWSGMTVIRHKLTGHSGEGIEIAEPGAELPHAPLYVQYIKKQDEYRIHVVGRSIILCQRKGARSDYEGKPNFQVRNHQNGFVFVRHGADGGLITPPESVLEQARLAIKALGLDFGAVDIIWNNAAKTPYVLEVNTAPGMEGSTVEDYANGFREYLK